MPPSRQFKENFVVAGCFTLSLIAFVVVLASFHLWYFLPVFLIGWAFVLFQSIGLGVWKRRPPDSKPPEKDLSRKDPL